MIEKKKVIIRRFDGVYCLVLVHKRLANPAHWIFEVTVTPAIGGRCDYVFKRYACGNYCWLDSFLSGSTRIRIKDWFPSWDFRKILSAVDSEVIR